MECERIQDLLSEYLDGTLPESARAGVSGHLRECRTCAQAAEGLESTVRLLKELPPMEAPPQLLERIRRETAREAPAKPLWKKLFLPAHIKIPVEAAAAILLFLLVYGVQKKEPPAFVPPPPAAQTNIPAPVPQEAVEPAKRASQAAETPSRTAMAPRPVREAAETGTAGRVATREGRDRSKLPPRAEAPPAQPSLPVVPAQRVSTAAEAIEPVPRPEEAAKKEAPMRMLAAPPSRVRQPGPYGREVILLVAAAEVAGLEERIVEAAIRRGGKPVSEAADKSAGVEGKAKLTEAVRIQLPAESAEPFLSDLQKIGTIPPEGAPSWADYPAGPAPGTVLYTVRIRVK